MNTILYCKFWLVWEKIWMGNCHNDQIGGWLCFIRYDNYFYCQVKVIVDRNVAVFLLIHTYNVLLLFFQFCVIYFAVYSHTLGCFSPAAPASRQLSNAVAAQHRSFWSVVIFSSDAHILINRLETGVRVKLASWFNPAAKLNSDSYNQQPRLSLDTSEQLVGFKMFVWFCVFVCFSAGGRFVTTGRVKTGEPHEVPVNNTRVVTAARFAVVEFNRGHWRRVCLQNYEHNIGQNAGKT